MRSAFGKTVSTFGGNSRPTSRSWLRPLQKPLLKEKQASLPFQESFSLFLFYVVTKSWFCSRCGLSRIYCPSSFPTRGAALRTRVTGQDDAPPRPRCSSSRCSLLWRRRLPSPSDTRFYGAVWGRSLPQRFLGAKPHRKVICRRFCLFMVSLYTSQSKGAKQTSQNLIDVFGSVTVRVDPNGLRDFRSGSVMGTGNMCFANATSSSVIMGRTENPGRRRQSNLPAPLSPDCVFCCGETLLSLGAAQSKGGFCLVFLIFSWRNPSSQAMKGSKLLVLFEER